MKFRTYNIWAIVIGVLFQASFAFSALPEKAGPVSVVENFCGAELNGARNIRGKFVRTRSTQKNMSQKNAPMLTGNIVFWDADPIFIVSSFSIAGVVQGSGRATVLVKYPVLLGTRGDGDMERKFVKKCALNTIVKYKLFKQGGEWFISDPPVPYISMSAIVRFYRAEVGSTPANITDKKKYTDQQRAAFRKIRETLDYLEKVSETPDFCPGNTR